VNREFASKIFGSPAKAMGGFFKIQDGTRIQVVGIVEDGNYKGITEDPRRAMFLPILQSPSRDTILVVRSSLDPLQLTTAIRNTLRDLDRGLPSYIETWSKELDNFAFFPSHVATISLGVLGVMGVMLAATGIFGMAAYSVGKRLKEFGIRMAIGARRKDVLQAALGRALRLLAIGSSRIASGNSGEPGAGFYRIFGNSARPVGIGWRCSGDVITRDIGYLDSCATRAVD
jgi:hypothetical protein